MNDFNLSNSTPKVHKHVTVYNKIYALIKDGTFPLGSQLPSEPELATMMDVSRMTLRRALALLQEDDLVSLVRGKGNFVKNTSTNAYLNTKRLNTIQHPFYACSSDICDDVELEFRIELPTESILESINQKSAAIVLADRWFMSDKKAVGYALSLVPIESVSKYGVDLTETRQLTKFLEETVYNRTAKNTSAFSYTTTGNFTAVKYKISQKDAFILIQESLFDEQESLIVLTKHYIPIEKFRIHISLFQDV